MKCVLVGVGGVWPSTVKTSKSSSYQGITPLPRQVHFIPFDFLRPGTGL